MPVVKLGATGEPVKGDNNVRANGRSDNQPSEDLGTIVEKKWTSSDAPSGSSDDDDAVVPNESRRLQGPSGRN